MAFTSAGERTAAGALRDAIGSVAVLANAVSILSSDVPVDCPGLAVPVDAFAIYQIDGYLAYSSATAADFQWQLIAPPDNFGNWTTFRLDYTTTGGVGSINSTRTVTLRNGSLQQAGGAGTTTSAAVTVAGLLRTYRFGGGVQLQFAQIFPTASATTIAAGSWLRVQKILSVSPS